MRIMKWLAALAALLIIVAVAAPFAIPAERYRSLITARVQAMTGRTLTLSGPMHLSVFPGIGLTAEDASLSNPPGFTAPQMLSVKKLTAEVALFPLLHGEVEVKRFVLEQPVIHLEVNVSGARNWQFTPSAPAPRASGFLIPEADAAGPAEALQSLSAIHGELKIENGTVDYNNQPARAHYALSSLDLTTAMPSSNAPLSVDGKATLNGQPLTLALSLDNLARLLGGGEAAAKIALKSTMLNVQFTGKATQQGIAGDAQLSTPSLPQLASWAGSPFSWNRAVPLAFSAHGALSCTSAATSHCILAKSDIALDAIKANGDVGAAFAAGAVPGVSARLSIDALDLKPYLQAPAHAALPALIADAEAATSGWSDAPMDLSALRAANADVSLHLGSARFGQLALGATDARAQLAGGVLHLEVPQAALYGGKASGTLTVGGRGAPVLDYTASASGIDAEKFLHDAAAFNLLSGTLALEAKGNAHGESERALVGNLSGSGSVHVTDGAIRGIDLGRIGRDFTSVISLDTLAGGQKTEFSSLGGTYTIASGVVKNNDLALTGKGVNAKGAGTVDLPAQHVSYRITPELGGTAATATAKAQSGLSLPLLIEGPFGAVSVRPDVSAMSSQTLKEGAKTVRDNLRTLKQNPDALKGLLNGLGR